MKIDRKKLIRLTFLIEGGLAVVGWVLADLFGIPIFEQIGFSLKDLLLGLLFTLPMLAILIITEYASGDLFKGLQDDVNSIAERLFSDARIIDLLIISILAGLGEELFFRGFLQSFLGIELGILPALLLASLVFGFLHYVSLTYAIFATVIGIYLGLIWLIYQNLLLVIIAHALYDFIALLYLTIKMKRSRENSDFSAEEITQFDQEE